MTKKSHVFEDLLNLTLAKCESWVQIRGDKGLQLIDPIEGIEISAHYGATHAAASFIIIGILKEKTDLLEKGKELLKSILKRWDANKEHPHFHADFNNFALCVAYDALKDIDQSVCESIKATVRTTEDSKHDTINWLPMRWYVNLKKYSWTKDEKHQQVIRYCKLKIEEATNEDGGVEDILPKGNSFNLQYDIATVSVLQFLRCRGIELDLSVELGFLLKNIAPDGDINYQGRGTNQIFAWGLWIYLLSSSNNENYLLEAVNFLEEKVPVMLKNDNIMLNDLQGKERYLWWDYHYCSVYTSHFLFWLVLSIKDNKKKSIKRKDFALKDSGVSVFQSSTYFVSTFDGRKKYLAESGPLISSLWIKKYGMIFKGAFAPWLGAFGNKYSFGDVGLRNYLGLLKFEKNIDWSKNKFARKIFPNFRSEDFIRISPQLIEFELKFDTNMIIIQFENRKEKCLVFNFPIFENLKKTPRLTLHVDGKSMSIHANMKIKTQYGWCTIYQSKPNNGVKWKLFIE